MIADIDENFVLMVLDEGAEFSDELTEKVDEIWEQKRNASSKPIYDGTVFQVTGQTEKGLTGRFIPYRYFYAFHVNPSLFGSNPIVVAAVTGITHADGKFLLAKRSAEVTEDPMRWEFAPSGGISAEYATNKDDVDYQTQLLDELEEELGISSDMTDELTPFLLVHEEGSGVIDLCIWIEISDFTEELPTGEYTEYRWLSQDELKQFIEKNSGEVTELAKLLSHHLE